jgi:Zn-dependent metalloprotease
MKGHICSSKCFCCFIPPQITDNLARAGVESARQSLLQSREQRQKRAAALSPQRKRKQPAQTGISAREVYDCQQQFEQRIELVRGEGGAITADDDVTKVYDYSGAVRDYFKGLLGRNSIDNLGMNMILNVHYGENYMNAFWDGDEMTFGDGDGEVFTSFAKSLDVVAHELAHGVTQFTSNLDYYSQSGALNEHFSDVFGTAVTQFIHKQTAGDADWLIGNEIMGPELYGEALRSMKEPGTAYDNPLLGKDSQPSHMKDYYDGEEDNQGVHINSGIPNKAFYLSAMEIGTDKAVLIWYTALQKLWATANFNDAVGVIVEAARLLTKSGQVPLGSAQTVRAAFKAVGLPC